jgi:hypothetical protein
MWRQLDAGRLTLRVTIRSRGVMPQSIPGHIEDEAGRVGVTVQVSLPVPLDSPEVAQTCVLFRSALEGEYRRRWSRES